jgi:enterochelin esterase-like enzyme
MTSVPLLILLHGVYGSHWVWTLKGGAHRAAFELVRNHAIRPLVIAMPSDGLWGDGSGYYSHDGEDYERWIMEDVVGSVREVATCVDEASPLFVSGLSMGGYAALRLGAKYAERVAGISAHSAITRLQQLSKFIEEPLPDYAGQAKEDLDLLTWMTRKRNTLPPLRFDCGTADDLVEANRELHGALQAEGVPHSYEEFPGEHNWQYWQKHIYDTLLFVEAVTKSR